MVNFWSSTDSRRSGVFSRVAPVLLAFFLVAAGSYCLAAGPQDSHDKNLDVRSSAGDLHVGNDADAGKTGLPLYPGAWLKADEKNKDKDAVNLGIFTEAFGLKLVVANYESNDMPARVIDFYRNRLKKYGKVLECHTNEHGGNVNSTDAHDDKGDSKALTCDGDVSGPVTELKVGTENNQHVVAIEPGDSGKGSKFALVYVHARGKQSDI